MRISASTKQTSGLGHGNDIRHVATPETRHGGGAANTVLFELPTMTGLPTMTARSWGSDGRSGIYGWTIGL